MAKDPNTEVEVKEELKGNQKKLDKNHNGKIDGQDFKILKGQDYKEYRELYDAQTEEEKKEFMDEAGIKESGLDKLVHSAYKLLGLQTYFTAGEKEVRA